ncbi:MAG: hypothetical protein AABY33_10880 [Pseudomonadota bacterium]
MSLPEREYFSLKSLEKRWAMPLEDIYYAIESGLLRACTYLEINWMEFCYREGQKLIVEITTRCEGWAGVEPKDCRRIFSKGERKLTSFISVRNDGHILRLSNEPPQRPITVSINDLMVLADDCKAFEELHKIDVCTNGKKIRLLRATKDDSLQLPQKLAFVASNNYQNIQIGEQLFTFGMIQAKIIKRLHDAVRQESPWVNGKQLLHYAGSTGDKLRDVFKSQPAWREIIESDGRGYYRLKYAA